MTDPEDSLSLLSADPAEAEAIAPKYDRSIPLEAEPADVIEQNQTVEDDDDYRGA